MMSRKAAGRVKGDAMKTIRTTAHINADGTLDVRVATGLPESDADVLVVVEPRSETGRSGEAPPPRRALRALAGACADDPLVRGEQGEYEKREALD